MSLRRADGPLTVHVPSADADGPGWGRVGLIAAIGFVVGVAWPRLAGIRLGPSVPAPVVASAAAGPEAVASSGTPPAPPTVIPAPATSLPPPAVALAARSTTTVLVGRGALFACKTAGGDALKGSDCGSLPGLDDLVLPRLRRLDQCPEAASAKGKLRLVVHPDFTRGSMGVELARNQTVAASESLLACARSSLSGVNPAGVAHENPRYSVLYVATFDAAAPDSSVETPPTAPAARSDGMAQVQWGEAIVRDTPKTGKVVARLQRGTDVQVGPGKDGWYPVKYGAGFASEGWVYRGAIGR